MSNLYVLDTSSLIDLQEIYPHTSFPTVWSTSESLIQTNRLISPIEVFNEICPSNTFLHRWCTVNHRIFVQNTPQIISFMTEIMGAFPALVDPNKPGPVADPFIIALAQQTSSNLTGDTPVIITQERNKPVKIPFVASNYGIQCVNSLELFEIENWQF